MKDQRWSELDQALEVLTQGQRRFHQTEIQAKIILLKRLAKDVHRVAYGQVARACLAKGLDIHSPEAAEEWLGGPMVLLRNIRWLIKVLEEIQTLGRPQLDIHAFKVREDNQVVAKVFPMEWGDRILFSGFEAEVWMQKGLSPQDVVQSMATYYQPHGPRPQGVCLVLGAGNVASIGPADVLYQTFVQGKVCILKMNPVNEYLGPFIEEGFRALIEADFLRVVYGGADVGQYLVEHPSITSIHMTGSAHTHDLIVWGPPEEKRKEKGSPKINKPITSELGCVTPVIIVPGQWSPKALRFQAENVATMLTNNGSFNCNAAKVLITSSHWPQRETFLQTLQSILDAIPSRKAYYPGADQRFDRFLNAYPNAIKIGQRDEEHLPWALITQLSPEQSSTLAFKEEAWCSVLAETSLDAPDAQSFLEQAVDFCNHTLWGTLSCSLIIDPKTEKEHALALDKALSSLKYGTIAVNHWPGINYGLMITPWGAYPGHTLDNIQSGRGFVHNILMFEHPEKTVLRGPFATWPKPPWFVRHAQAHRVAQWLTHYEYKPSLAKVACIAFYALRG